MSMKRAILEAWFNSGNGGSGGGAVDSVNGKTGNVVLNANDVGAASRSYAMPDMAKDEGKRLNDVFASFNEMAAAYSTGDFSKINVGDYWEMTLNGQFRDYGNYTLPEGATYYNDTACTDAAGTATANTAVSSVNDEYDYCEVKISGVTKYCKIADCLKYEVRTLNNAKLEMQVGGIDQYWKYGDSGTIANGTHHLAMVARDCLPVSMKMRPSNSRWTDIQTKDFTVKNVTGTYSLTDTAGKIRYIRDNGRLLTYNTHYTVSGTSITLKAAAAVTAGDTLTIEYTDNDAPWLHCAVYKTLNDEEYGIAALVKAADPEFWQHCHNMRITLETVTPASSWSYIWADRGKVFLPMESEVWDNNIFGHSLSYTYRPQMPIFASQKYRCKGIGYHASRASWWEGSFDSLINACYVYSNGYASYTYARFALGVAPSFCVI